MWYNLNDKLVGVIMKRYLLKLSGEALSGDKGFGFSSDMVLGVAKQS